MWSSCPGSPSRRLRWKLVNDQDTKVSIHFGSPCVSYNHPLLSSTFCCVYCHLLWSSFSSSIFIFLVPLYLPLFLPSPFLLGSFHWFTTYRLLGYCNLFVQTRTRNIEDIDAVSFTPGCELQQRTEPVLPSRNAEQPSHLCTEALVHKEKGSSCFVHNALCCWTMIPFINKDQHSTACTC